MRCVRHSVAKAHFEFVQVLRILERCVLNNGRLAVLRSQRPIGKIKKIDFGDIREIEELEYGEFVLQCSKRDYTFKVPDEQKCQIFVHNLRQLRERHRVMQEGAQQAAEPGRKSGSWLRR